MGALIVRRLLLAIPTFLGITLVSFALMHLAPGDPLNLLVFDNQDMTAEQAAALRRAYHVDDPLPVQYADWLVRMLRGDLGTSFRYGRPALGMIAAALPNTLQLAACALLLSLAAGVPLGVLAARHQGTALDTIVRVVAAAGDAVPGFWLGLLFILTLGVQWRLFPIGGMATVGADPWDVGDRLHHLVGPVLALSLRPIADLSRYLRAETLDVLGQEYVRTARAKGLRERAVLGVHVFGNALLPTITYVANLVAALLSGSVVVEQVFSWPGFGRMAFEAARSKDYPVAMAVVVVASVVVLASYLLRDVAYGVADPRTRQT